MDMKIQSTSAIGEVESKNSASVPEPPSSILKLDIDCFEELFEWLSLFDLRLLRRVCKRLQQVVDYFIRTNYPSVKIGYGKIYIFGKSFNNFQRCDCISVKKIKKLRFFPGEINTNDFEDFKVILPQIENFLTASWILKGDFYDLILKYCSNLKYLSIKDIQSDTLIGNSNQWLLRCYPLLEHIELLDFIYYPKGRVECMVAELTAFFELNPNVRVFSTTSYFLCENGNCLLESKAKIDRLEIDFHYVSTDTANEVGDILKKLYDQGFYKNIHVYCKSIDYMSLVNIAAIRGMEKLYLSQNRVDVTLELMPELRELCFDKYDNYEHLEMIAVKCVNLERVWFNFANFNAIIPFLRYTSKLKEINVKYLQNGIHFEKNYIKLVALNKERKKLTGASKVTIYVEEDIFLETKFALSNTELSLVTLKRAEAAEWTHSFGY